MLARTILIDELRFLSLRAPSSAIGDHFAAYLAFGLIVTWVAGVGRYWDANEATLWHHLGLNSLAYVLAMALILWILVAPLRPKNWSYRNVLLFVTLTSPPALLYVLPVETWLAASTALEMNAGFLAVVAVWRVALLVVFLKRVAALREIALFVATLLPLAFVVDVIAFLGLGDDVYTTMAGLRDPAGWPAAAHEAVVQSIGMASAVLTPVLLGLYGWLVYAGHANRREHGIVPSIENFGESTPHGYFPAVP